MHPCMQFYIKMHLTFVWPISFMQCLSAHFGCFTFYHRVIVYNGIFYNFMTIQTYYWCCCLVTSGFIEVLNFEYRYFLIVFYRIIQLNKTQIIIQKLWFLIISISTRVQQKSFSIWSLIKLCVLSKIK